MHLLELVIPEVDRIAWVEPVIRDCLAPSAVLLGRDSTVVDDVVAEMTQVAEEVRLYGLFTIEGVRSVMSSRALALGASRSG